MAMIPIYTALKNEVIVETAWSFPIRQTWGSVLDRTSWLNLFSAMRSLLKSMTNSPEKFDPILIVMPLRARTA